MAEPGNFKFRERWWKQVLGDRRVVENVLAAALAISTEAHRDGTRALMSNLRLAEILEETKEPSAGIPSSFGISAIWS